MNFDFNDYGFGREWGLIDYESELEKELKEKLGIQPQRAGMMVNRPQASGLDQYLPTSFDTQGTADAIKAIDAMMGVGGTAPTGVNPEAPAESQPPAVTPTPTAVAPNKYERMQGVTDTDRLSAVAMGMTAIGSPDFARVYGGLQAGLVQKQKTADEYNMLLDKGTKPQTKISGNNVITMAPDYIRNSDGTYSVNPDAGKIISNTSATAGLEGLTDEQRALVDGLTGDNKDTMVGFLLGKNAKLVPEDMTFDQFVSSPLNSNQGETSKSFNRNTGVLMDQGYTQGQAQSLAMLAENGGLEIVRNTDTGEIKAIDPVTQESFVIEDYQTGLQKIVEAAASTQDAKNRSDLDKEQVTTSVTRLDEFDSQLGTIQKNDEVSSYWIDKLSEKDEYGNYVIDYESDFGWANSLLSDYFGIASPEFSGLEADAVYEALQNLDITNLAPVSNFEFKQVMKLFANGKLASREQVLAVLKRAQARADRERGEYQRKYDNELESLKGIQGEEGVEYKNYSGRKTWITDEEARNIYRRKS